MEEFFSAAGTADDVPALWKAFRDFLRGEGITRVTAVHIPPVGAPDQDRSRARAFGFPDEWNDRYMAGGLHGDDPMPAQASIHSVPFRWSEIRQMRTLTPAQEAFLEAFAQVHAGDGIAIPVFGPNGRNGYVGLGLPEAMDDIPPVLLQRLQVAAQYAHQQYCRLVALEFDDYQPLSPRELEVLGWVARGKSNSVIADILGVSGNTVDTHLRRIYGKLHVTDRVSAVLAGLGHGLVSLS